MQDNKGYLDMQMLRFTTAGSVDDGKSTLIGRLLYDSKSIFEDQLEAVEEASRSRGNEEVNLALLTDGLRAEREQGITIDVAYRYFATPKRKFIIADTPGHVQYTRNMVTGASTADLAVILVDARHGIMEQTVRHSFIASLLGIREVVVAVNKMDLVDFSEEVFTTIVSDYRKMEQEMGFSLEHVTFIPISAQYPDFRSYAGQLCAGTLKPGDRVTVLPSGLTTEVTAIWLGDKQIPEAVAPLSIAVTLQDDIDISRGDVLEASDEMQPGIGQEFTVDVCWLRDTPLETGRRYLVRHAAQEVTGIVKAIEYKIDINTQERIGGVESLRMNDIARIRIKTAEPLVFTPYEKNRVMGSLVFIDESNDTVGAGMIKNA
ncbi:MAG: GTP-binding protein [Bacteroidales bacterium]|nr:GTP-binding protein [Bacteroidales bacterium]